MVNKSVLIKDNSSPNPLSKAKHRSFYYKPVLTQLGDLRTVTLGSTPFTGTESDTTTGPYYKVDGILTPYP